MKIKGAAARGLAVLAVAASVLFGCTDSSQEYLVDLYYPQSKFSEYMDLLEKQLQGSRADGQVFPNCEEVMDRLGPPMTVDDIPGLGTDWDPAKLPCLTRLK